ncbi:MAG: insulinase family protein [Bacteroidales bacterium]|nr:insulinase family protein [Candidatus Egerieousia equi]
MKKLFCVLAFVLGMVASASAQFLNPQQPVPNDTTVVSGKLDNGLTYYIKHNEKPAQRADFYIVSNVGSIQQDSTQGGLAHFLEHMCFNGLKDFPDKELFTYLEGIGAKFGANINAGTGIETTSYMLNNIPVTRTGIVDSCLLILQNYGAFVTCDPKAIDDERGVIIEEKRTRNTASWRYQTFMLNHLAKGSKYALALDELIGSEEQLKTFKPQTLVDYYHTWYRPDLQAIIVVGDVDVNYVENQIKKTFNVLPKRENPKPKEFVKIPGNEQPITGVFTDKEFPQTQVTMFFKQDPIPVEYRNLGMVVLVDLYKDVASTILNERFNDIASKPDAPFLNAGAGFNSMFVTLDMLSLSVQTKEDAMVSGFQAALNELERAKRFGFTNAEFERAKSNVLKRYERAAENEAGRENGTIVYDYINAFTKGYAYPSPSKEYEIVKGYFEVGAVTLPAINQLMAQAIDYKDVVILAAAPEKEGIKLPGEDELVATVATAQAAELTAPVEENANEPLVDAAALKGSKVKKVSEDKFGTQKVVLANGVEIYLKKTDFKKDEVMFKIYVEGGKSVLSDDMLPVWSDDLGNGSIFIAYAGLSKFPQPALEKALAGKAAHVSPFVSNLSNGISGSGSPKDFETMMQLAYLYFVDPRFNADEINVGVNMVKQMLPNILKDPNTIFGIEFQKTLFGNSPRRPQLDENFMDKATVEKFEQSYRQLFSNAKNAKMFIVGNVELSEIQPMLEKYIGSLPMGKKAVKKTDNVAMPVKGKVENVFKAQMTAPKTTVGLVYNGNIEWTLKNAVAISALKNILDLTYTKTIREEEGGTYGVGVGSQLSVYPESRAIVIMQFDTDPAKADKLCAKTIEGIEDIAANGVCQDYIDKTRETMLKSVPEQQITNGYWLGVIDSYVTEGHDVDTEKLDTIKEVVTSDNIKALANAILSQGNFAKIIMSPEAAPEAAPAEAK